MAAFYVAKFQDAIKWKNLNDLKTLLEDSIDVDHVRDEEGKTPLLVACEFNRQNSHLECIEYLLKIGADVNAEDDNFNSCLTLAAKASKKETSKLLLEYGADADHKNEKGRSPTFSAIAGENFEAVQFFLDNGSSANEEDETCLTLLSYATKINRGESHLKISELLLEKGADVNAKDFDGKTPIHYLVSSANVNIFQLFLYFKAGVDMKDNSGEKPLSISLRGNNLKVVELLIKNGSDVNAIINDNDGSTPLHEACKYACDVKILKTLLKNGANMDATDFEDRTPFMTFIKFLHSDKLLL